MIPPVDARYAEGPTPKPYEDHGSSRDNALMFAYRQERQKMSANLTHAPPLQRPQHATANQNAGEEAQIQASADNRLPAPEPMPASRRELASSIVDTEEPGKYLRGTPTPSEISRLDLSQHVLSATCAACLSADSMCTRGGGVFCGTCNKEALIPRMESLST